ncbi:MAG: hypothetical protein SGPRY_004674, partial [Prymnesium sp.]
MAAVALPAPPAVPPPPIVASLTPAGTRSASLMVPANHPLVLATPFLGWDSAPPDVGGAAQVSLATWQMLTAFGGRLCTSKLPADLPASLVAYPLNLCFSGAAWTRILNEYLASGLLNTPVNTRMELQGVIRLLSPANPLNLKLIAADWALGEGVAPVATVAAVAAVPGRAAIPATGRPGRVGYRAAVAAVAPAPAIPPSL